MLTDPTPAPMLSDESPPPDQGRRERAWGGVAETGAIPFEARAPTHVVAILPVVLRNPIAGAAMSLGAQLKVRGAQLSDWQATEVSVPVGPQGQPSYRLLAYSRSVHKARMCADGSREDLRVIMGPGQSSLGVVCLGRTSARGEPEESARQVLDLVIGRGQRPLPPVPDSIAGEHALRYSIGMGASLTEWKFAHDGWLFAAGVVNCSENEETILKRTRAVLDSWRWN